MPLISATPTKAARQARNAAESSEPGRGFAATARDAAESLLVLMAEIDLSCPSSCTIGAAADLAAAAPSTSRSGEQVRLNVMHVVRITIIGEVQRVVLSIVGRIVEVAIAVGD